MDRTRQKKWDREHLVSFTGKLRVEEARQLRRLCEKYHTTPYTLIVEYLRLWMRQGRLP